MAKHFLLAVLVSISSIISTGAFADAGDGLRVKTHSSLEGVIHDHKIYIQFRDSQKLTSLITEMMRQYGYSLVESKEDADIYISLLGRFELVGGAREGFSATYAELAEAEQKPGVGGTNYTHQTINAGQIAVATAATRYLSLTDIGLWLTQKTGIAGRVNETLTGDPRGICLSNCENWKRLRHIAMVSVYSLKIEGKPFIRGAWTIDYDAYHDALMVEDVMSMTILKALEPFRNVAIKTSKSLATEVSQ